MSLEASTATQLTISLRNISGSLARMCDVLRAAKVNINAICGTEKGDMASVHMILDDLATAKMVLKDLGEVTTEEVLAFDMANKPGAIFDISRRCAGAAINIRNIYATTHGRGKGATVYVVVDDVEKARSVFR